MTQLNTYHHHSYINIIHSIMLLHYCFFFFSSRRRHTRLQGDWSSDVCSSDLPTRFNGPLPLSILSYEHPHQNVEGGYWDGQSGWPFAATIAIESLERSGRPDLDRKSVV